MNTTLNSVPVGYPDAHYQRQGSPVCGLYAVYTERGLFIPTSKTYQLGDEVFLLLNLMDETEKIPVAGKVVWITPERRAGEPGGGDCVQFNAEDEMARNKIETYLAGALSSDRPTHTHVG